MIERGGFNFWIWKDIDTFATMKKYITLSAILFLPAMIYFVMARGRHGVRRLERSEINLCSDLSEERSPWCDTTKVTVLHFGGDLSRPDLAVMMNLYETVFQRLQKTQDLRFVSLVNMSSAKAYERVHDLTPFVKIRHSSWLMVPYSSPRMDSLADRLGLDIDEQGIRHQVVLLDKKGTLRLGLPIVKGTPKTYGYNAKSFNALKTGLLEDVKVLIKEYHYAYKHPEGL